MRVTHTTVLDAISRFLREHEYPPTVREIGGMVGLSSASSVHHHLLTLRAQGLIEADPTKPRAMRITEAGRRHIARRRAAL